MRHKVTLFLPLCQTFGDYYCGKTNKLLFSRVAGKDTNHSCEERFGHRRALCQDGIIAKNVKKFLDDIRFGGLFLPLGYFDAKNEKERLKSNGV